ncbi:MAG: zinc-ribbon domain-containing protein [Clostridiaceae bacterium]|nr:zinc ribbon domain-containing protein [Eubacteriales bacterium]
MSDILSGLFKGLSGLMPQEDPEVKLFQAQTELTDLRSRETELYAQAGKRIMEQEGSSRFPDLYSQLELVKSNVAAAEQKLQALKSEKDAAERAKKEAEEKCTCPNCGSINPEGINFCQECGTKLGAPAKNFCTSCGAENAAGARFCGGCGARLGG